MRRHGAVRRSQSAWLKAAMYLTQSAVSTRESTGQRHIDPTAPHRRKVEHLRCVLPPVLVGGQWPHLFSNTSRELSMVEGRNADLKGAHAVISSPDNERGRPDGRHLGPGRGRHDRLLARLFVIGMAGVILVDVLDQVVGHQRGIVKVHTQVPAHVVPRRILVHLTVARLPSEGRLAIRYRSPPVTMWQAPVTSLSMRSG